MAVSEFVKQESSAKADSQNNNSTDARNRREKLALLGDEENHVGAGSQLRHLERHRNDDAQSRASDYDGCSDFASVRWRQLAS
jgi:hypothetical protein